MPEQASDSCEHFPFATNRTDALTLVEAEHRQHAVVELAIRDLNDQALTHFPSGKFCANAAWTVIAALAHNLLRWTSVLGLPGQTIGAARTLRRRAAPAPPADPTTPVAGVLVDLPEPSSRIIGHGDLARLAVGVEHDVAARRAADTPVRTPLHWLIRKLTHFIAVVWRH